MSGEPQTKKLKLFDCRPGIPSGIISASKSGAADNDERALSIKAKDAPLSEFFDGEDESSTTGALKKYNISKKCLNAFDSKTLEDDVRYAVFEELKKYNDLEFSKASHQNPGTYKEQNLKNLFKAFSEELSVPYEQMSDREQGLLVTTTSRPDLSVLRKLTDSLIEVKFGELKQGSCTVEKSTRQGLLCLHSLLYFYRVKLGVPVDTVYGFTICGPKCTDLNNQYSVGLLKMTAPRKLGDLFSGQKYIQKFDVDGKNKDSRGLQLLVHFLTKGNVSDLGSVWEDRRKEQKRRGPYLFAVPRRLWSEKDAELILGGTCAMVFRVPLHKVGTFLQKHAKIGIRFEEFFEEFKQWKNEQKNQPVNLVYVKVRTEDTATHFDPTGFESIRSRLVKRNDLTFAKEFLETYVTIPYIVASTCCVCVMADRGDPVQHCIEKGEIDKAKLRTFFREFKRQMINDMTKYIFHGDVLPHNFVSDKNSMHLIDFDEGADPERKVPKRSLNFELRKDERWFEVMLYPNVLRRSVKAYTTVQFAATVILFFDHLPVLGDDQQLMNLIDEASVLAQELSDGDKAVEDGWDNDQEIPGNVKTLIDNVNNAVVALLDVVDHLEN